MARPTLAPMAAVPPGRPWVRALGFGLISGVLAGFALVGLIAAPLFLWAEATEPGLGLQRPLVRNGLRVAPVLGLVTFAMTAAFATWWRYRTEDAGTVGDADRRSRATPE